MKFLSLLKVVFVTRFIYFWKLFFFGNFGRRLVIDVKCGKVVTGMWLDSFVVGTFARMVVLLLSNFYVF